MTVYAIENTLCPLNALPAVPQDSQSPRAPLAVSLTFEELARCPLATEEIRELLMRSRDGHFCKAELRRCGIVGAVSMPSKSGKHEPLCFSYFLRREFVLFCCDAGKIERILERLSLRQDWASPDSGELLCSVLFSLIDGDLLALEALDTRIEKLENAVLCGQIEAFNREMPALRKRLTALQRFYSQLIDAGQKLIESGERFLDADALMLMRLLCERCMRLREEAQALREYAMQVREEYQAQIDLKQNRVMQILTVVTVVFMPLTLIAGWFGMNLKMPEFEWDYGYPMVIGLSVVVVALCMLICKKKKFW